ncbi:MAG: hypothetical protein P4L67_02620 [Candidatus Pacebacteria bacterium]|nr:hypothetical protein [Candidatus Paceibacterota bacterium]
MQTSPARLAKDPYWPVREAAANVLVDVANVSTLEIRESTLVKMFLEFYGDVSRFVKKAAQMQLGNFLFSLKGAKDITMLIQLYVSMDPRLTSDEELIYHCAFTFPGVLLALGAASWPILRETYKSLIKKGGMPQVRGSLAASIHEVAKIVGGKVAAEELDPILKGYLNDFATVHLCFAHLHEYLQVLEDKERLAYLELVEKAVTSSKYDWRLRELFAKNAEAYAKMFDVHTVHTHIMKIVYSLLQDQVIEVRMQMCASMYALATLLHSEQTYFDEAMNFILKLFSSPQFRDRQTFLCICEGFMCNEALFDQYLLTQFLALQKDRVINVRLSLARILHNHMKCSGVLAKNVHINRIMQLLQTDPAREVREGVLAASIECDKMKEVESERLRDLEQAQEAAGANLDVAVEDEEELAEVQRQKAEQFVKKTIKIDEIDDKAKTEEKKGGAA